MGRILKAGLWLSVWIILGIAAWLAAVYLMVATSGLGLALTPLAIGVLGLIGLIKAVHIGVTGARDRFRYRIPERECNYSV